VADAPPTGITDTRLLSLLLARRWNDSGFVAGKGGTENRWPLVPVGRGLNSDRGRFEPFVFEDLAAAVDSAFSSMSSHWCTSAAAGVSGCKRSGEGSGLGGTWSTQRVGTGVGQREEVGDEEDVVLSALALAL